MRQETYFTRLNAQIGRFVSRQKCKRSLRNGRNAFEVFETLTCLEIKYGSSRKLNNNFAII